MVARRGKLLTLATPRRMRFERVFSRIAGCLVFSTRRRALLAGIAAGFGSFCASTAAQADQPAVAAPASPDLIGPIAGALAIGLAIGAAVASFILIRRHAAKMRDFQQEKRLRDQALTAVQLRLDQ